MPFPVAFSDMLTLSLVDITAHLNKTNTSPEPGRLFRAWKRPGFANRFPFPSGSPSTTSYVAPVFPPHERRTSKHPKPSFEIYCHCRSLILLPPNPNALWSIGPKRLYQRRLTSPHARFAEPKRLMIGLARVLESCAREGAGQKEHGKEGVCSLKAAQELQPWFTTRESHINTYTSIQTIILILLLQPLIRSTIRYTPSFAIRICYASTFATPTNSVDTPIARGKTVAHQTSLDSIHRAAPLSSPSVLKAIRHFQQAITVGAINTKKSLTRRIINRLSQPSTMGLLRRILRLLRRRRPVHPKSVQVLPADAWGRYGREEQEARVWQQQDEERAREEARRQQHRRAESEERRRQRRAVEKERQRQQRAEEEEGHRQWHAEREEEHRRRDAEERRLREEAERLAEIRRAEQAQDEELRVAVENRLDMMVQAKDSMKQAKGVSEFRTAKWRFSVARQDYEEALDERISFTQGRRQSLMEVRETVLETIQETIQEMGSLSGTPEKDT